MRRETKIRIDGVSQASLLNRYIAYCSFIKYYDKGSVAENKPIKAKNWYQIQWKNIKEDIRGFLKEPRIYGPAIAYSLMAFLYILTGNHTKAVWTAFFIGSIAIDSAGQSAVSGEPASITWNHTIGVLPNRLVVVAGNGLALPNLPTFNAQTLTQIGTNQNATLIGYLVNPNSGVNQAKLDGGNIKVGASVSFSGVDQSSPIGATNSSNGDASPFAFALTTQFANSIRLDILGANKDNSTVPTASLDAGTLQFNPNTPQNQFRIDLFGYTNPTTAPGLTTRIWTTDAFTRNYFAIEIKELSTSIPLLPLLGVGT